jgi:hypothetical protein
MDCINLNENTLNFLHNHELKILLNEEENICSICNIRINKDLTMYLCEKCSLIICPQCIHMLYLIPKYQIKNNNLKEILSHNSNCKPNYIIISNNFLKCNQCNNSEDNFLMNCKTCKNFNLCMKCFSKSSNRKIAFSFYIHEHPMKEVKMDSHHMCDICEKPGNYLFSSFQCKKCDLDICENCLDKMISIKQPIKHYNFLELKKVKSFYCNECENEFSEKEKDDDFNYMFSDGYNCFCINCFYKNKKINYEIVNNREIFNTFFFDSGLLINENEELKKQNEKIKTILGQVIELLEKEKKKNNNGNEDNKMGINELKDENDKLKEGIKNAEEKINELNLMIKDKENDIIINKKEMNKKLNQLYNSKDQIEKLMKEEISVLKSKITGDYDNKLKEENTVKNKHSENEINKMNLKIDELNKLIIQKDLEMEKLNNLIIEKEKANAKADKLYKEVNGNYMKLIKKHKEEKKKIDQLIKHFDIKNNDLAEILNNFN